MEKNYQRKYLRAPLSGGVLFSIDEHLHQALAVNISEGGILLDGLPFDPGSATLFGLICLPDFPEFKNLNKRQIHQFNPAMIHHRVIKFQAQVVRTAKTSVNSLHRHQTAVEFLMIDERKRLTISEYVEKTQSNLILLLSLFEKLKTQDEQMSQLWPILQHLGYPTFLAADVLEERIKKEYQNLVW